MAKYYHHECGIILLRRTCNLHDLRKGMTRVIPCSERLPYTKRLCITFVVGLFIELNSPRHFTTAPAARKGFAIDLFVLRMS